MPAPAPILFIAGEKDKLYYPKMDGNCMHQRRSRGRFGSLPAMTTAAFLLQVAMLIVERVVDFFDNYLEKTAAKE